MTTTFAWNNYFIYEVFTKMCLKNVFQLLCKVVIHFFHSEPNSIQSINLVELLITNSIKLFIYSTVTTHGWTDSINMRRLISAQTMLPILNYTTLYQLLNYLASLVYVTMK